MTDKKELKQEQLEQVSGGSGQYPEIKYNELPIGNFISENDAINYKGRKIVAVDKECVYIWIKAVLDNSYEASASCGNSVIKYKINVLGASERAHNKGYIKGQEKTISSSVYELYLLNE